MSRMNISAIWDYFDKDLDTNKRARCRLCCDLYSYQSSTGNLKTHLRKKHPNAYAQVEAQPHRRAGTQKVITDDAAEELLKVTDVWSYFDIDSSGKRAQCVPCKATVANEYEELKAHLKDNHPKLLLQILQKEDHISDASSNDGESENENVFTEVVYLDPEPTDHVTKKEKAKSFSKPIKKRERIQSYHSIEEIPIKKPKQEEVENDELSTFIKYITCLLKKLPPDAFSSVQIEILNAIQKANAQALNTRSILFNKEQINTCSNMITVDGISPISSNMVGANYTITVAPQKQDETESS